VDVEVVGELVQERVEHSAVACHLAQDGGAHPGPEDAGLDRVVAMELGLEVAVANPVPSHAQDLELGRRHAVEVCEKVEQLLSRAAHPRGLRSLEGRAQPFGVSLERLCGRELQRVLRVARLVLLAQAGRPGDRIRDHERTIAPGRPYSG